MNVETFECQETAAEPIEATEEAVALMDKLGLKGQKQLVTKSDAGFDVRCPYRKITAEEFFVYRTLCPQRTKLEEYDDGPIPLRVLQVAAHAMDALPGSRHMHVWHRAVPAVKDPVLVATNDDYIAEWTDRLNDKIFILARWGEELEAFATLIKRATDVARDRLIAEARQMASNIEHISFGEMAKVGPQLKVKLEA